MDAAKGKDAHRKKTNRCFIVLSCVQDRKKTRDFYDPPFIHKHVQRNRCLPAIEPSTLE